MKVKPIRTPDDLDEAKRSLEMLIRANANGEKDDDVEVLSTLMELYEQSSPANLDAPTPIAAIRFRMEEGDLSPRDLVPFIGSRARVSEILAGKRALSIEMIRSLHSGLGIPYESLIAERQPNKALAEASQSRTRLSTFEFGNAARNLSSATVAFSQDVSPALHRKTRTQRAASKTDQSALLQWQASVLKKSAQCSLSGEFSSAALTAQTFREVAKLSRLSKGPLKAIGYLAEKGICVVALPQLPGTYLDGAAMLDHRGNPVIGLTLRFDKTDSFWFTLLHELAHIHLHLEILKSDRAGFVDDIEMQTEDSREREADEFARKALIPDEILAQGFWGASCLSEHLHSISSRARVHVCIAAGRWQREHGNYKKFSRLIERDVLRPMLLEQLD